MSSCKFWLSAPAHPSLRWRSPLTTVPTEVGWGGRCTSGLGDPGQGVSLGGAGSHGLGSSAHVIEWSSRRGQMEIQVDCSSYLLGRVQAKRERVGYSAWLKEEQGRSKDSGGDGGAEESLLLCPGEQLAEFYKGLSTGI